MDSQVRFEQLCRQTKAGHCGRPQQAIAKTGTETKCTHTWSDRVGARSRYAAKTSYFTQKPTSGDDLQHAGLINAGAWTWGPSSRMAKTSIDPQSSFGANVSLDMKQHANGGLLRS